MEQESKSKKNSDKRNRRPIVGLSMLAVILLMAVVVYLFYNHKVNPGPHREKIQNVIIITIDTLRADYLSCYQEGKVKTPNIDQLAATGVRFEQCISQSPLTLPSHTSILSGTYPLYHQVRDNGGAKVPDKLELVSEVLQKNGFTTSAFVGAYVLHSKWGLDQGFDTYSDDFDLTKFKMTGMELEKRAEEVLTNATQWIAQHKEQRFFPGYTFTIPTPNMSHRPLLIKDTQIIPMGEKSNIPTRSWGRFSSF